MSEAGEPVDGGCLFHLRVCVLTCPQLSFDEAAKKRRSDPQFRAVIDDAAKRLRLMDQQKEDQPFEPFQPPGSVNQFRSFGVLVLSAGKV